MTLKLKVNSFKNGKSSGAYVGAFQTKEIICIIQSDSGEQVIIMRFLHIGLKQIRQIPQRMEMPETEVLRIL